MFSAVTHYMFDPALNNAIQNNSLEDVKRYIQYGADVNHISNGDTPLTAAVKQKNNAIVKYLLENGADPNKNADENNKIIPLGEAIEQNSLFIFNLLLAHGAHIDKTLLPLAINKNNVPIVTSLLKAAANPDHFPGHFYKAIEQGNLEIINLLITYGIDVNKGERYGYTHLIQAIEKNDPRIVARLLDAGADANFWYLQFPLNAALKQDNQEIINLLFDHDVEVNAECRNTTPLHQLMDGPIDNKHKKVGYLLQHGADPNKKKQDGTTPLVNIIRRIRTFHEKQDDITNSNDIDTVDILLKAGADPNLGGSLAEALIADPNIDVVLLLLKNGADPNAKNHNNQSAFDIIQDTIKNNRLLGLLLYHLVKNENSSLLERLKSFEDLVKFTQEHADKLPPIPNKQLGEVSNTWSNYLCTVKPETMTPEIQNSLDHASRVNRELTAALGNKDAESITRHYPKKVSLTSSFCTFPANQEQPMELESPDLAGKMQHRADI